MELRYSNSKPISQKVLECLRYLSKVGVMERDIWYNYFGSGSKRWRQKQLKQLLTLKILKLHPSEIGSFYILGYEGEKIIEKLRLPCVTPTMANHFRHDVTVAQGILKLQSESICNGWLSEKELTAGRNREFLIKTDNGQSKYPDAVFKFLAKDKKYRTVALEYERHGKSSYRYRQILWSYNSLTSFSLLLFVVDDETIKKRIQGALKFLGSVQLVERVAFMSVEEWLSDPLRATIELRSKSTSFDKLQDKEAS